MQVPEMVDFRAMRENKMGAHGTAWRASRDIPPKLYDTLSSDPDGGTPCIDGGPPYTTARLGYGSLCTSCSRSRTRRLCECALTRRPGQHGSPLNHFTRPGFDMAAVRECCITQERAANQTRG